MQTALHRQLRRCKDPKVQLAPLDLKAPLEQRDHKGRRGRKDHKDHKVLWELRLLDPVPAEIAAQFHVVVPHCFPKRRYQGAPHARLPASQVTAVPTLRVGKVFQLRSAYAVPVSKFAWAAAHEEAPVQVAKAYLVMT